MTDFRSRRFQLILAALATAVSASLPAFADGTFSGNASWYGVPFHGKKTASGEIFDMNKLSAAHKTIPFQTKVLVENPKNGKSAVIKVNDRGPFVKTRVMDLSRKGADSLGYLGHGTAHLDFTILGKNVGGAAKSDAAKPAAAKPEPAKEAPSKSDAPSKPDAGQSK